jgi:hypothetical protein
MSVRVLTRILFVGVLTGSCLAMMASPGVSQSPTSGTPAPSATAPSAGPTVTAEPQDIVMLSGAVVVPRGQAVGQVVVFHGRATILGVCLGDVVVLDGPVTVLGQVSGSVIALNGPVRLGPNASVRGDVLGSTAVRVEAGAVVEGDVRGSVAFTLRGSLSALGILLGPVAIAFSSLLLGLALLLLVPRGADRIATAARSAPLASLGWGVVLGSLAPIVALAISATVVGIPLGLALLLGLGPVLLMGYVWSLWALGRVVLGDHRSRWGAFLAGWAIAAAVGFVPFLNLVAWPGAAVFGVGVMAVAVWRARGTGGRHRAGYVPAGEVERQGSVTAEPVVTVPDGESIV